MVFQGSNLIISANGNVLAASKSCSLDVDAETIKTSSPNDGQWNHSRAGRKSWSLTTNHLMVNVMKNYPLISVSSPSWVEQDQGVTVNFQGITKHHTGTGVWLVWYYLSNGVWSASSQNFDTSTSLGLDNLIHVISSYMSSGYVVALACRDVAVLNASLISTLNTTLHIPTNQLKAGSYRSFVAIGNVNSGATGLAYMSDDRANGVHAQAYYIDGVIQTIETPLRRAVQNVGSTFDIQVSMNGNPGDILHGSAICKKYTCQATQGNLLQGSFAFEGSGPLE